MSSFSCSLSRSNGVKKMKFSLLFLKKSNSSKLVFSWAKFAFFLSRLFRPAPPIQKRRRQTDRAFPTRWRISSTNTSWKVRNCSLLSQHPMIQVCSGRPMGDASNESNSYLPQTLVTLGPERCVSCRPCKDDVDLFVSDVASRTEAEQRAGEGDRESFSRRQMDGATRGQAQKNCGHSHSPHFLRGLTRGPMINWRSLKLCLCSFAGGVWPSSGTTSSTSRTDGSSR